MQHAFDGSDYVLPPSCSAAWRWRWSCARRGCIPPCGARLALLLLGALGAPEWALGGWAVHLRLPAVFGAMLFASAELRMKPPVRASLAVFALTMIAGNAILLTQNWLGYDRQYREFQASLEEIPRGARLLTVLDGNAIGERSDQPYWHMAEFAIPERGVFTPLAVHHQGPACGAMEPALCALCRQPRRSKARRPMSTNWPIWRAARWTPMQRCARVVPYLDHFQCHFDIAVVVHLDGKRTPVPPMLRLRHAGSFFSFYDILPDPDMPAMNARLSAALSGACCRRVGGAGLADPQHPGDPGAWRRWTPMKAGTPPMRFR